MPSPCHTPTHRATPNDAINTKPIKKNQAMSICRRQTTCSRLAVALTSAILLSNLHFGSAFITTSTRSTITGNYSTRRFPCFNAAYPNTEARGSNARDYLPKPTAGPIADDCRLTEEQIHSLLRKRGGCKLRRQYEEADDILNVLNQNGVYVHDKRREWRADGQNHFGRQMHYTRRGGTYGMSEEDVVAVSQMVEDWSYAKRTKKFHRSDELTDTLKAEYRVKVNDKNREWSVVISNWDPEEGNEDGVNATMHYVPSPLAPPRDPTHTMDDETKARIAQRLADRVAFRNKKDYRTADKIRDELMEQYSIVADDRTREWKVVLGNIEDDEFASEAQLSQRSAFVRRGDPQNDKTETRVVVGHDTTASNDAASSLPDIMSLATKEVEEEEEEEIGMEQKELQSLTVVQLKEKLQEAGLPVSGKKADLIARLNA